jgi:hypothetical protein
MLEVQGSSSLRPLGTIALIDAAIEHVREDPRLFYGITLPVSGPLAVVVLAWRQAIEESGTSRDTRIAVGALAIAVLLHLRSLAQGAATFAVARRIEGEETTIAAAWRAAASRAASLAFAGVVFWWSMAIGGVATGLPILILVPVMALVVPAVVFEGRPAFSAVARSAGLGRLEIVRTWGLVIVLALAWLVLTLGTGLTAQGLVRLVRTLTAIDMSFLDAVLSWTSFSFLMATGLVAWSLLEPVKCVVLALLYVDRRVRTEGFDLKHKVALVIAREAAEEARV